MASKTITFPGAGIRVQNMDGNLRVRSTGRPETVTNLSISGSRSGLKVTALIPHGAQATVHDVAGGLIS